MYGKAREFSLKKRLAKLRNLKENKFSSIQIMYVKDVRLHLKRLSMTSELRLASKFF